MCRGGCFESCRRPSIFVHPHLFACFLPRLLEAHSPTHLLPEEPRVDEIYRAMGTTGSERSRRVDKTACGESWWWRGSGGFLALAMPIRVTPGLTSPLIRGRGDQFQTYGSSQADRWYASTKPLFRVLGGHERWSCRNADSCGQGSGKTKVGRCDCF